MKIFKILFIIGMLFLLPSYSYSSASFTFRTGLVQGDVRLKTENTSEWMSVLVNMPLMEGDHIQVPE